MPEYLIYFNDEWVTECSDEGWRARSRDVRAVIAEMRAAGVFVFTGGLDTEAPVCHAVPRDGEALVTDGPYVETREVIGGIAIVDVPDEAQARHWAGRIAVACDWPQEVRPFRDPGRIPTPDADREAAARRPASPS